MKLGSAVKKAGQTVSEALLDVSGQAVRRSSHLALGILSGESTRELHEAAMNACGTLVAQSVRLLVDGSGARGRAWEALLDAAGTSVRYGSHYTLALASGEASISFKESLLDAASSALRVTTATIIGAQDAKRAVLDFICGTTSNVAVSAVKLLLELAPSSPLVSPRVSPRVKFDKKICEESEEEGDDEAPSREL